METKLKECPFCGGEAQRTYNPDDVAFISCADCGSSSKIVSTMAEAEQNWNSRTATNAPTFTFNNHATGGNNHQIGIMYNFSSDVCNDEDDDFLN